MFENKFEFPLAEGQPGRETPEEKQQKIPEEQILASKLEEEEGKGLKKEQEKEWRKQLDEFLEEIEKDNSIDYNDFAKIDKNILKKIAKENKEEREGVKGKVSEVVELRYYGYLYQLLMDVYEQAEEQEKKKQILNFFYDALRSQVESGSEFISSQLLSKSILIFSRHNDVIKEELSIREVSQTLLDLLLKKDSNLNKFTDYTGLANIFSQDRNYCVNELFDLLREGDDQQKRVAGKVLQNLEYNRVGIEGGTVRYLNKEIDLVDEQDEKFYESDGHVSRISSEGDIGIFNKDEELKKIFNIGIEDLSSEEKHISKKVFNLSYDNLFIKKEEESQKEREQKLKYLEEFKKNYYKIAGDKVFGGDIELNNLTLQQQGWLLVYFNEANEVEKERLRSFVNTYGEQGIKTFFSLEFGQENGEKILELGEKFQESPYIPDTIFNKYAEMVDRMDEMAEEAAEMYEEVFFEKQADKDEVKTRILKEANKLLQRAYEELEEKSDLKDKEEVVNDLISDLEREVRVKKSAIENLFSLNKEFHTAKYTLFKEVDDENYHDLFCQIYGDPDKYKNFRELIDAVHSGEIVAWWMYLPEEKERIKKELVEKLDSQVISYTISKLEKQIKEQVEIHKNDGYYGLSESSDPIDLRTFQRHRQEVEQKQLEIKKLKKLKDIQKNLETQLDQFVYGITDLGKEDQNLADRVFSKYHELVVQASRSKKEIKELFKEEKNISEEEIEKISENTLSKARALLEDFSQKMIQGEELDEQEVMQELENYNSDLLFTASVMKTLKKEFGRSDVDIENLEGVTFEEKTISDLVGDEETKKAVERIYEEEVKEDSGISSPSLEEIPRQTVENFAKEDRERIREIKRMMEIYKENYEDLPALQTKLLKTFAGLLEKGDDSTILYLLKKDGELLAFCRFSELGERQKEFGAFNVPGYLHNSAIGSSFLKSTLEKEAEENDIYGDCGSTSPISSYYINGTKGKFTANKVNKNYGDTGEDAFSIFRARQEQKQQEQYHYHDFSSRDIIREYEDNIEGNKIDLSQPCLLLKFEKDSPKFIDTIAELINEQKYVMTNYVIDENNDRVYAALEKNQ